MLGNWSFGDYFKAEAIEMAFKLLTDVYGLDPDRLYATYFEGDNNENIECDDEAVEIWKKYLPSDHIVPGNKKDNFWEMGPTGPCGPCSEIHYDLIGGRNAAHLVNKDDPNVIEIWNIVFIQFNREPDGSLKKLPKKHIDTGMGFERLVSILQGTKSNYDTDIFREIFDAIQLKTNARPYQGKLGDEDPEKIDMAYRVVADHIRTLTFAISDGAIPGPVGRGYVLRRILRRAIRYGKEFLKAPEGFFSELVPVVVNKMKGFYPKLEESQEAIIKAIRIEEKKFEKSLITGTEIFKSKTKNLKKGDIIPASDVFLLYNTHGFPDDLTRIMAEERGLSIDHEGFEKILKEKKEESRKKHLQKTERAHLDLTTTASSILQDQRQVKPTDDQYKYSLDPIDATIVGIWDGKNILDEFSNFDKSVGIVLDKTNFYGESGGQIGDKGVIEGEGFRLLVEDTKIFGHYVLHFCKFDNERENSPVKVGSAVHCEVDMDRRKPTMSNHTSTHIVNFALRSILGDEVEQQGSVVYPKRLRFDYSYSSSVSKDQLRRIDELACEIISKEYNVYYLNIPLELAKSINGIRAMFGEKYPNPVRVVSIGVPVEKLVENPNNQEWRQYPIELCGGTHLSNVKEAQLFTIVQDSQHEQGVRRLVAVTGEQALEAHRLYNELEAMFESVKKEEDPVKLRFKINEFIGEFEKAVIPAWKRIHLREQLEVLQAKAFDSYKDQVKQQASSSEDYVKETIEKLKNTDGDVVFWVDIFNVGANNDALHKTAKALVEGLTEKKVAVLLLSSDTSNPKKPRVIVVSNVPKESVEKGLKANEWAKETALVFGGKAGGKDQVAQGSGTKVESIEEAKQKAIEYAKSKLN